MIGVLSNILVVCIGGIIGALLGKKLSREFCDQMTSIFSVCALGMGVMSIGQMQNMPPVILAVVCGSMVGLFLHLGDRIVAIANLLRKPLAHILGERGNQIDMSLFITALVLFCSSGTGIYGCLDAGMTGNATILLSKAILDLFTSMIFACSLGIIVSFIAVPQALIFFTLFFLAKVIYPMTTPEMICDFKACGGFLLLATGLRMAKIKEFPVADMIPAMIFVMPLSYLWTSYVVPLIFR